MQMSLKVRSSQPLACSRSILLQRDWTFAKMIEGSGGRKGLVHNWQRIPLRLPLSLGHSSVGKSTAEPMVHDGSSVYEWLVANN